MLLCRQLGLFTQALAAVDGSKFKAVNTRDKNFTATKLKKRMEQVAKHIAGYLQDPPQVCSVDAVLDPLRLCPQPRVGPSSGYVPPVRNWASRRMTP